MPPATPGRLPPLIQALCVCLQPLEVLRPGMQREFIVVEEEDEYGEIILSVAAIEVRGPTCFPCSSAMPRSCWRSAAGGRCELSPAPTP
jgi:hypothetical protein